jgi:hypothetical protein
MTNWRLVAEQPAFDRSVPLLEEMRPFVFGKWQVVDHIILLDPAIPSGHNWLYVHETTEGEHRRSLEWFSNGRPTTHRFYVPAPPGTGFPTETPLYEGHWRRSVGESSELLWPTPDPQWRERASFLARLDRVELVATRIAYRGFSMCRLCGKENGHEALRSVRWEWPAGFRHYVAEHDVRPSPEFEDFINNAP